MSADIGRTRSRTFTESSPPLVRAYLLKTKATGTKTKISERNRIQKINKISISRNRLRIFSWNVNSANKFSLETFYHSQEWNLKHLHLRKPQFSTTIKLLTTILMEEISPFLSEPTSLNKDLCIVFEEIPKKI